MVADTLVYHPTVTKLVTFLDSTPKREKSFRLLAYLSRFLAYYLQRKGYPIEWVNMWSGLKGHFTFIRKGMRFFKPINHLQTAAKTYDNKLLDPVLQSTTVIRNLGYAGYLTLDSVTWFKMLGIIDKTKFPTISKWASRFWLLGLIAGIVNSLHIIRSLTTKTTVDEKVDQAAIDKKLYSAKRKLIWDLLDSFIALNSLDILHFTEGDVGLAGIITSIMGLKDLWVATP
ncbi:peroxisomal biogenesis factor 11 [Scheffersomyces xylosifermentans]|uniref:peroxisomal biogenesis factor 11 n=1 Tax=Scheffersomyces xylosifermentans TaxID=1304137 RepID=UPI00315CF742